LSRRRALETTDVPFASRCYLPDTPLADVLDKKYLDIKIKFVYTPTMKRDGTDESTPNHGRGHRAGCAPVGACSGRRPSRAGVSRHTPTRASPSQPDLPERLSPSIEALLQQGPASGQYNRPKGAPSRAASITAAVEQARNPGARPERRAHRDRPPRARVVHLTPTVSDSSRVFSPEHERDHEPSAARRSQPLRSAKPWSDCLRSWACQRAERMLAD
jgi:hypothetical protein